ncbi:DEAD/DEAH box helicase [bacterium]|nr:DEAD/DEAH box helicase [bacterium]MBT3581098.1 DEAD/DEAH box helicase [bacterium]MBT4552471.1 DEAD/DEAH box helicase [bacterium]MBT5988111.1 DEAD/DEAH box helicase [bacterium]MBT7087858.1 DEAD/DEAH box helicase [bacterium]
MENKKKFNELGLSARVLEAINKKGFEEPTAIQAMTIPVMLRDDTNIIAQAQTGTGKTAAFGLPLIELINPESQTVQAMILVPTRELAIQVSEEINSLKGDKDIRIIPIYGGQSIDQQLRRLKRGVHIVVGTPGRVIDHLNRRTLKLGNIEHLILDEADEMLNMGFVEDMEEIMKHTNADKRTLLFSATMPQKIKDLARKYMDGYELLTVKKEQLTTNLTEQIYFEVKNSDKLEALCRIIDIENNFYGLVFCRTKSDVDYLASHLMDRGYDAEAIHGDISQAQRERTLEKFKKQRVDVLVATDVAARGIDVNNLTHVINYSLPHDPEAYVHRIGRTGRAGNQGTAITFISPSEYRRLMVIQRVVKTDIKKSRIPRIEDIIKAKKKKISDDLTSILKDEINPKYSDWANKLLEEHNPTEILAALLNYSFEEELNPNTYGEIKEVGGRGRQVDQQGKARLFVALGKKDRLNPRKLVDLITSRVSIKARDISDVSVMDNFSFITVPFDQAEQIFISFKERGQKPLISHAKKK